MTAKLIKELNTNQQFSSRFRAVDYTLIVEKSNQNFTSDVCVSKAVINSTPVSTHSSFQSQHK